MASQRIEYLIVEILAHLLEDEEAEELPALPVPGGGDAQPWEEMAQQALREVADLTSDIRGLAQTAVSGVIQGQAVAAQKELAVFC